MLEGDPRGHQPLPRRAPGRPPRDDLVRLDRDLHRAGPGAHGPRGVRGGDRRRRPDDRAVDALRLRRAAGGRPVRQRRAEPHRRHPGAAPAARPSTGVPICGKDFKTGQTLHQDGARADAQGPHARPRRAGTRRTSSATATARCSTIPRASRRRRSRSSACSSTSSSPSATPSSTATSTTRCASTTTRRAATTRRAGTTSTSSAGSATRCRSRSTSSAATRSSPRRSRSTSCSSSTSRSGPGSAASRSG